MNALDYIICKLFLEEKWLKSISVKTIHISDLVKNSASWL